MKKLLTAAITLAVTLAFVPAALASQPTRAHLRQYQADYASVRKHFGPRAAGCNLVGRRGSCHVRATDEKITASLGVLDRMLNPPRVAVAGGVVARSAPTQRALTVIQPSSGLAACIIQRESGGNPQAVNPNGHYGLGQWDQATWIAQGGGRYASTPLGATASQQIAILNQALANGQAGAWTPYDHC